MDYNLLLGYLSAMGQGEWQHFRVALQELAPSDARLYPSAVARRLSELGHVEFAFEGDLQWTICPPTLAWLPPSSGPMAVLCGSRDRALIENLTSLAKSHKGHLKRRPQPSGPDAIYLQVPSQPLGEHLAAAATIKSTPDAAQRLAEALPPLSAYQSLFREAAPLQGFACRRFEVNKLQWHTVERLTEPGLYRFDSYRPAYRLYDGQRWQEVSRSWGIYWQLQQAGQRVLRYDAEGQQLWLVRGAPPLPLLYARALTLASGLHRVRAKKERAWCFSNIGPALARRLLVNLGQSTEEAIHAV